nr:Ig-like domain-containing protein [Candidatus Krumholzibacteria bacterium]
MLTAGLSLLAACAVVEAPPGGPQDTDPPFVTFVMPDSGATDLGLVKTLRIAFSEKMDRQPATSWLHFFPDQRVKKTKWKGATVAEVELEDYLPADTLIVVEIAGGMKDAHKVPNPQGRRFPIATGDSIPLGSLAGLLLLEGEPLADAVVELFSLEPDSLEYYQRPLVRRTETDDKGAYRFNWLPVPGGPWVARAFGRSGGSLRPGDNDPQRLLPDTLSLTAEEPLRLVDVVTLYKHDTPGRLLVGPFAPGPYPGEVFAFARIISDADTGYVARAIPRGQAELSFLFPDTGGVVDPVPPGTVRVIAFVDVDADSSFSVVPDTVLGAEVAARTDTVTWYLEPWTMVEGLQVEPGLPGEFVFPLWTDSLVVAQPPPVAPALPAMSDSLAALLADSLGFAVPDTLTTPISSPGEK